MRRVIGLVLLVLLAGCKENPQTQARTTFYNCIHYTKSKEGSGAVPVETIRECRLAALQLTGQDPDHLPKETP